MPAWFIACLRCEGSEFGVPSGDKRSLVDPV